MIARCGWWREKGGGGNFVATGGDGFPPSREQGFVGLGGGLVGLVSAREWRRRHPHLNLPPSRGKRANCVLRQAQDERRGECPHPNPLPGREKGKKGRGAGNHKGCPYGDRRGEGARPGAPTSLDKLRMSESGREEEGVRRSGDTVRRGLRVGPRLRGGGEKESGGGEWVDATTWMVDADSGEVRV